MMRKGQAAMEFLMTYGWAILAAVIAIGVLVYLGVFNPAKSVPESCVISQPFGCSVDSYTVNDGDVATPGPQSNVTVILTNGGADDLTVQDVGITGCGVKTTVGAWTTGEQKIISLVCGSALITGAQFKGAITVNYTAAGGTRLQTSAGSIVRKVIAS